MSDYEAIAGYEMVDELNEYNLSYEFHVLGSYEFHVLGLFRKKDTGELFYGTDSGCSCPEPWDATTPQDLTPIVPQTFEEFERAVMDFPDSLEDRRKMIDRARMLLAA